jgi:HEAT repeat protein
LPHRVGLMRTFAQAAGSPDERARWLRAIEAVFMDPAAPDRLQAIETIGKLGHPLTGEGLAAAREFAATRPEAEATLAHWALAHAEEPSALPALQEALKSTDGIARLRAAYALRWLRPPDLAIRAELAAAATAEPADSPAYAYLISAALSLHPNHPQTPTWHSTLEHLLHTGAPHERYEAAQTLMRRYSRPHLARLIPLFDHPHGDVRLAAAWTVLHVLRD